MVIVAAAGAAETAAGSKAATDSKARPAWPDNDVVLTKMDQRIVLKSS